MQGDILARIRDSAAAWLTDRCKIEREVISTGQYGDVSATWATVADDVPCRMITARRSDLNADGITAGQETLEESYRLAVAHNIALDVDQRVTVGGVIYHVVRIEAALSDKVFTQVILARKR